jgi:serine/threonine protein kinase
MTHWHTCELPDNALFPEQYTVQEVLRDGLVSSIFLGYDKHDNKSVVIKCFKPSAKNNYLREIGATFDIKHPNILRCLNTFHRADGVPCIVYEYLAGGSLLTLMETQRLNLASIIACLQAMLNALIYLHGLKRIHCDIKPENILLRSSHRTSQPADYVLIDLGAACFLREAQEGHHVTGTPAYIAPERIKNQFFMNSDLYSLGVIAYEMVSGQRPFTGNVEEITQANLTEIPSVQHIEPAPLRDFIDHLLVKNPRQRIESAALASALLHKLVTQTERLANHPPKFANPNAPKKTGMAKYLQFDYTIEEVLLAIQCFNVKNYPLIALVYAQHVDFIDPLKPQAIYKSLMTHQSIQVLSANSLAYATPSRIQTLNLANLQQTTLKEQLGDLKLWHVDGVKVVWGNAHYCFYEDLSQQWVTRFTLPNYLFSSKIAFTPEHFVTSEGIANNKIVLRDMNAQVRQEWQLDDPIVAMTTANDNILAVTLSLNNKNEYTIWQLALNQTPASLLLSDNISQMSCQNNAVFYVRQQTVLESCTADLSTQVIYDFQQAISHYALSQDNRFVVACQRTADNTLLLTILKNREL